MPKINVDELCEPIEVTVGGKVYVVEDIAPETARLMEEAGRRAEAAKDDVNTKKANDDLSAAIGMLLGAPPEDIAKLGMRKRLAIITGVMGVIQKEAEGKNAPKAAVAP